MLRTGEARIGFFALWNALLAARQGVVLFALWNAPAPLTLDAGGLGELAIAACAAAGLVALFAQQRSIFERDRAESLHWNSMEAVRILGEVATRPNLTLDERLDALLTIGCERFELEIGLVSRVDGERYEVVGYRAPEDFPLSKGAVLLLADTCCTRTLASDRPLALERIDAGTGTANAEHGELGFRAYFGVAVRVFGEPIGTLCFASPEPRKQRFTATDKDLLNLMAQWVGSELERRSAALERKAHAEFQRETEAAGRPTIRRHEARAARPVDVNAAIRRSAKNLHQRCGDGIELDLAFADDLAEAARLPIAVGGIVESIVVQAVGALAGDGRITIDTANLKLANRDPNLVPSAAPNHYVTVSITAAGDRIEADSFAHAFDPPEDGSHRGGVWDLQNDLPLATIYRLLQRAGGDLSVEIEPGRSCSFTVFLPAADAAGEQPQPPTSAAAPTSPH
jgi:hypothetical protein